MGKKIASLFLVSAMLISMSLPAVMAQEIERNVEDSVEVIADNHREDSNSRDSEQTAGENLPQTEFVEDAMNVGGVSKSAADIITSTEDLSEIHSEELSTKAELTSDDAVDTTAEESALLEDLTEDSSLSKKPSENGSAITNEVNGTVEGESVSEQSSVDSSSSEKAPESEDALANSIDDTTEEEDTFSEKSDEDSHDEAYTNDAIIVNNDADITDDVAISAEDLRDDPSVEESKNNAIVVNSDIEVSENVEIFDIPENESEAADDIALEDVPTDDSENPDNTTGEAEYTGIVLSSRECPLNRINQETIEVSIWYVNGDETVPYVDIALLNILFPGLGFQFENGLLTSTKVSGYVKLDAQSSSFTQHKFALIYDTDDNYQFPVMHTMDVYVSDGVDVTVNIEEFGYRLIEQEDSILLPMTVLSAFFTEPLLNVLAFDGQNLYAIDIGEMNAHMSDFSNQMIPLMYTGPWTVWSPELRQANYEALCLRFDKLYGFHARWPEGFDVYLTREYNWLKDALLQAEGLSYVTALNWLFSLVMDEPHTSISEDFLPPYINIMTEEEYLEATSQIPELPEDVQRRISESPSQVQILGEKLQTYQELRSQSLGITPDAGYALNYYNDMAVLVVDIFNIDTEYWDNYNMGEEISSLDTPGFLYTAFSDIRSHPEVTKVVFDLTTNTGGNVNGVKTLLGFIKQNFRTEIVHGISNVSEITTYRFDTNLDGIVDENDSYEGLYDFYILQSGATFSAGNLTTHLAKSQNAATIIGECSGGGSYSSLIGMDSYGMAYLYSGISHYGDGTGQLYFDDIYVEPDIELAADIWYDYESLRAALGSDDVSYYLTVTEGEGSGEYKVGESVTIRANTPPDGKQFEKWTWNISDALIFTDGSQFSSLATFYMPASDLNVQANFVQITNTQGCYVATAVYGSYDCPEVWTLRRYRDYVLAKKWYGRIFIHLYYAVSPTIVAIFGETGWFKEFWRARLDKMVSSLRDAGFSSAPYDDMSW